MLYYIILYYIILYKDTSICTYLYIYIHIHTYILYIHLSIYTYIHIHIDHWPTQIQRLGCNGIGRVASSHEAPRSLLNITHPQMIYVQEWRVSLLWTYSFHTAIERAEDGEKTNMFDDAWCMYCIYVYIFFMGWSYRVCPWSIMKQGRITAYYSLSPLYCSQNSLSGRQIDETQYAYVHRRMYI